MTKWHHDQPGFSNHDYDPEPEQTDPRWRGFNYGAALPVPTTDGVYNLAHDLAERLRAVSHEASDRAWRIDMAVRDYRHATTAAERDAARKTLANVYADLYRYAPLADPPDASNYTFAELKAGRHDRGWRKA
jgi:hypothetical protein